MSNPNFWKDQYQHAWDAASKREKAIIARIKQATGLTAIPVGLGAGLDEYIPGTASSRGFEKGGADLQIEDTNLFLEVTGPMTKSVPRNAPLWLRPDKIENAKLHYPERETWVIHWLERDETLRVIKLDESFFENVEKRTFQTVHPCIRGQVETYVEIPASHECVKPWEALIRRIKELGEDAK